MRLALLWLNVGILLGSSVPVAAQAPLSNSIVRGALGQLRPEVIRAHMRFLADDTLEGRGTGTRGYELAAKYVAAQFEALGVEPAADSGTYFQSIRMVVARARESECALSISSDGGKRPLTYGTDFVMFIDPSGPDVSTQGPVVFVGYGVSAPNQQYDDYAGLDVAGKIVAYLPGAPSTFRDGAGAYYGRPTLKRETAFRHGALGILRLSAPDDNSEWAPVIAKQARAGSMQAETASKSETARTVPELAYLSTSGMTALFESDASRLRQAIGDVKAGRPQSFLLARGIAVTQRSERFDLQTANVIGRVRGSDPVLAGEYVAYIAHLDGWGIGVAVNGDAIYNGARDNASGVAAVLAVARAFASLRKAPRRSILFVATTAEEPGLLGSEYFVGHSPVALQSIVAAVNLDGLTSFWPLRDVEGWGARHTSLGSVLRRAAAQLRIEATIPEQDGAVMTLAGDQVAFATKGIPVVWLVPGKKTWDGTDTAALEQRWRRYHQPDDDMSQPFDFGASAKTAQMAFLVGYIVLDEKARPNWREGDFFGQAFAPARNP